MSDLPLYITELLCKIAASEGFVNHEIFSECGSNHGDNFTSVIVRVSLRGQRTINGKTKNDELNLLCKFGSPSAERRKEFLTTSIFEREIYMYKNLLPTFDRFQTEKGLTNAEKFTAYPKFYAGISDDVNEHYVLILEDLKFRNYAMWPKCKAVPIDHARLLVEQLGKFHGISIALKHQQPERFEEYKKLDDFLLQFFRNSFSYFEGALDLALKVVEDAEHIKVLEDVKLNALEYMAKCVDANESEPISVVGHGDCWNNNALYQYEAEVFHL